MIFTFIKEIFNNDLVKATSIATNAGEFYGIPIINEDLVSQVGRQAGVEIPDSYKRKIDDVINLYNKKEYEKAKKILMTLTKTKINAKLTIDLIANSSTLKEIKNKIESNV